MSDHAGANGNPGGGSVSMLIEALRTPRVGTLLLLIPAAVLLLPILAFPLSPDGAMFFVSAQKILAGAAHYRDIVDVKPPLIYYLYAAAIALFGSAEWSVRVVDLLLQIATCWLIITICRQVSTGILPSLVASIAYALIYVGLGNQGTTQTESYVGLVGLSAWAMVASGRTPRRFLIAGMLCGVLFLLKFTLAALLGVLLLSEMVLFDQPGRRVIRNAMLMLAGFALVALLLPLYLLVFDAWTGYAQMQQFLEGYVLLQIRSLGSAYLTMMEEVSEYLPGNYTILLLIASAAGIATTLLRSSSPDVEQIDTRRRRLLSFCTIASAAYAVTIVLEGKYFAYQFSRVFPFAVILAGFGVQALRSGFAVRVRPGFRWWLVAVPLSALAIILSPLPHYLWHSVPLMLQITSGTEAVDRYYSRDTTFLARTTLKKIGGYVRENRRPGDKVMILSSTAGLLYYHAGYLPDVPIYHSAFVLAPFAPQQWRDTVARFITQRHPRFLVVEYGDPNPLLTATERTSSDLLRLLPGVDTTVARHYKEEFRWAKYVVMGRTGD